MHVLWILKEAFDSVWHNGLFHKLEKLNIMGNFLSVLKNMYAQTLCSVKIDRMMTRFFSYSKGVRQGCTLSPSLFNIYLNDLVPGLALSNSSPLRSTERFKHQLYDVCR